MNKNFNTLLAVIDNECSEDELLEALYVLRAPKHLVAIIPMCRAFRDSRATYPELNRLPELANYSRRLGILDCIADLEIDDDDLTGARTKRYKSQWTPLRPHTGDSVIGELLLTQANAEENHDAYGSLSAWLMWQVLRFQVGCMPLAFYREYLLGDKPDLKKMKDGSRPYSSYLELQKVVSNPAKLSDLLSLNLSMNENCAVAVLLVHRIGELSQGSEKKRLEQLAVERFGYTTDTLKEAVDHQQGRLPAAWGNLLKTVWGDKLDLLGGKRGRGGAATGRTVVRPEIRYSTRLAEMFQRVGEQDDVHSGTAIDFFERDDGQDEGGESDDPEEAEQREPIVSLFLADSDNLISGYYASKNLQATIEHQNAQLRWTRQTLSKQAIGAVCRVVETVNTTDDERTLRARFAIGLSLISGRSLEDMATPFIVDEPKGVSDERPVIIRRDENRLYLWPGQPKLKHRPTSPHLLPCIQSISLRLPRSWRPMLAKLPAGKNRERVKVAKRARELLRKLPDELKIKPASIRQTFISVLLEETNGDIGVQKVITDGAEANTQNIIHYASYSVGQVESWWIKTVKRLVGALWGDLSRCTPRGRVGTPYAFDVSQLGSYFRMLKAEITNAEADADWVRAFNRLTLYLSYWLGLDTAGRKSRTPFPKLFLANGWVMVADKHRTDGSTDRLLPITTALRQQIEAYVAIASELAVTFPGLEPVEGDGSGTLLQLHYITSDGTAVPYLPKYQETDGNLRQSLPANWGRKVMRSESADLPGRSQDALLGHWTRGRHPWDMTSTLDANQFHSACLRRQNKMERRLGFSVVTLGGYEGAISNRLPCLPATRRQGGHKRPAPTKGESAYPDVEVVMETYASGQLAFLKDANKKQADKKSRALEMVRRVLHDQIELPSKQWLLLAETCCAYVRQHFGIPLYAARPRPLFSSKHLVDGFGLQALAYFQQRIEQPFLADLQLLPAVQWDGDTKAAAKLRRQELGRLIMLAIWRLGMTRWAIIESWLRALFDGAPILASGTSHYMLLRVKAENRNEVMRRTVFLDAFTTAYITIEREHLNKQLLAPLFGNTNRNKGGVRRTRAESALTAYLKMLDPAIEQTTLSAMMAARVQSLMLQSSPLIAAYSKGAFLTQDMGDDVLRRLAGLHPVRRSGALLEADLPASKKPAVGDAGLPKDIIDSVDVIKVLLNNDSADKSIYRQQIEQCTPVTPIDALLQQFALWLLARAMKNGSQFKGRERTTCIDRVTVIALSLLGQLGDSTDQPVLDDALLMTLYEGSHRHFHERVNHGAWDQFYRYLSDNNANHAGFEVGRLSVLPNRGVSARILSASELAEADARILSAKSGIGNSATRESARRHLALMATFGLRRAESAFLRDIDCQGDLIRVQAYGSHTLKTTNAERVLPLAFAKPGIHDWLTQTTGSSGATLITPDLADNVDPNNFYDAFNTLLKDVTGDESVGSHHLRHTFASQMTASLLQVSAGLSSVAKEFPWLAPWLVNEERINVLLGESDGGQGLRAVSTLMGHSHPTTTLTHYVHILCIMLFAALRKGDSLNMTRSFEQRLPQSTVQRWAKSIRKETADIKEATERRIVSNGLMRDQIVHRLRDIGIDRDETPIARNWSRPQHDAMMGMDAVSFDRLEKIDRSLRDGHLLLAEDVIERSRRGLEQMVHITSGKKGSSQRRHALEPVGLVVSADQRASVWLPKPLAAGSATRAADGLCHWLAMLRDNQPEDFHWLLEKWLYASEKERGRMRLDSDEEVQRAESLPTTKEIRVEIKEAATTNSRKARKAVSRMRIRCLDEKGNAVVRDTHAVRWVMSYVCAVARE